MLKACFSAAGIEGLVRIEEKLNAPKYLDSLNENPVQSIQNVTHSKNSLLTTHVNVLEWPSQSLSLNPIKYFWKKTVNVRLPSSNLTELESGRAEEKNGK